MQEDINEENKFEAYFGNSEKNFNFEDKISDNNLIL